MLRRRIDPPFRRSREKRMTPEDLAPTPPAPHLGPLEDDRGAVRERFDTHELAVVLSHYNLGVISRIREYRRGSRRAPKVRITAEQGEFLLKRRAPGRDDPQRVAFAQDLQLYLAQHGFPIAEIIRTRPGQHSMLQLGGRVYEMFCFVEGTYDDRSAGSAQIAGATLGQLHRLLNGYQAGLHTPRGSYHAAEGLDAAIAQVPSMVHRAEPGVDIAELQRRCRYLREAYNDAARRAEDAGLSQWPHSVVHGDWHPGNIIYRDDSVAAVLDFDSARLEPRVIDVANGALQFSMRADVSQDPDSWPDRLDAPRIRALLRGYDQHVHRRVAVDERRALPWLIVEALILESVIPIAATGRFASLSGSAFLRMVERKVRWLRPRSAKLVAYLEK